MPRLSQHTIRNFSLALLLTCTSAVSMSAFASSGVPGRDSDSPGPAARQHGRFGAVVKNLTSHRRPRAYWEDCKRVLAPRVATGGYEDRRDYAVALIHLGEAKQAVRILRDVEFEVPGEYATALHLGTAYEQSGDYRQALKWIREAIKRTPESQRGGEWVHVKVLEAKINLDLDPGWFQDHTVLGIEFGNSVVPIRPAVAESIRDALSQHLQYRLQFANSPNPLVADLLADLANLYAATQPVENAIPIYKLALKFKPARTKLIKKRLAHLEQRVGGNPPVTANGIGR